MCDCKNDKTVNPLDPDLADLVGVCTVVTIHPVIPEHAYATHCPIFAAVAFATFQYMLHFIHVAPNLGNDSPCFFDIATDIQGSSERNSW